MTHSALWISYGGTAEIVLAVSWRRQRQLSRARKGMTGMADATIGKFLSF
jgi:hypothetical protein